MASGILDAARTGVPECLAWRIPGVLELMVKGDGPPKEEVRVKDLFDAALDRTARDIADVGRRYEDLDFVVDAAVSNLFDAIEAAAKALKDRGVTDRAAFAPLVNVDVDTFRKVAKKRFAPTCMVAAVRKDAKVGRGSCTVIDETFTDDELLAALTEDRVRTPGGAVRWARRYAKFYEDRMGW